MNAIFQSETPEIVQAFKQAQKNFKYFWREMYWEYRRIIPAIDLELVKIGFTQDLNTEHDHETLVEFMWINDIEFDGEYISGTLMNEPHELTTVSKGQFITLPFEHIVDWLFVAQDIVYGAFSIQEHRKSLSIEQRQEYDAAWGLNFADPHQILVVNQQQQHPEYLIEHPMSLNSKQQVVELLQQEPELIHQKDEQGNTFLHREAIAGNRSAIEIALQNGADPSIQNTLGKTAYDYALQFEWEHLIPILNSSS